MPSGTRPDKEVQGARDRERDRQAGMGGRGRDDRSEAIADRRASQASANAAAAARSGGGGNPSQYDSRVRNPRYSQNLIASGPLTPHNMWEAFKALPTSGIGAVSTMLGALGVPGLGPQYEGVTPRSATGFSYDAPGRFGTMDGAMGRPKMGVQPVRPAGAAQPQPAPNLQQLTVPAATLGGPIQGLGNYQVNLPSYGYFGTPPAQQRPGQSAILNPMRSLRPGPRY